MAGWGWGLASSLSSFMTMGDPRRQPRGTWPEKVAKQGGRTG
jgi:hypothetical protein